MADSRHYLNTELSHSSGALILSAPVFPDNKMSHNQLRQERTTNDITKSPSENEEVIATKLLQ